MCHFAFDSNKSQDENIGAFFNYLQQIDPELGQVLEDNIDLLTKYGDMTTTKKNNSRQNLNEEILNILELGIEGGENE